MTLILIYFLCFLVFLFTVTLSLSLTIWYINNEDQLDDSSIANKAADIPLIRVVQRLFFQLLSDKVLTIWEVAIFSVIFNIFLYILAVHFGAIKDGYEFENNIFEYAFHWYIEITTSLTTDLIFWGSTFAFLVTNNTTKSIVRCLVGKKDGDLLSLPFSLLSFGVEKALLLFATTSATLSVLAANHYPNKWFIFFVFMIDSVMFLGILFIPLVSNKIHETTKIYLAIYVAGCDTQLIF